MGHVPSLLCGGGRQKTTHRLDAACCYPLCRFLELILKDPESLRCSKYAETRLYSHYFIQEKLKTCGCGCNLVRCRQITQESGAQVEIFAHRCPRTIIFYNCCKFLQNTGQKVFTVECLHRESINKLCCIVLCLLVWMLHTRVLVPWY